MEKKPCEIDVEAVKAFSDNPNALEAQIEDRIKHFKALRPNLDWTRETIERLIQRMGVSLDEFLHWTDERIKFLPDAVMIPPTANDGQAIQQKEYHEAGHAVVGIALKFKALRLTMRPSGHRGAGVDFEPTPKGMFVLDKPVAERREYCLRLVAQFAAGYLAEQLFFGGSYEPWVAGDGDRATILNKAVWGVATKEDQAIIDGKGSYETWAKKHLVEALIQEAEQLALNHLVKLSRAVKHVANIAHRQRGVSGAELHKIVEQEMARLNIAKPIQ